MLLAVTGCYGPTAAVGLPCSPERECPEGQECAADDTCQLPGGGGEDDGGPGGGDDGGPGTPDAMPIPLESWLTSYELPALERAAEVAEVGGGFALLGNNGTVIAIDPRGQVRWQRRLEGFGFTSGIARVTGGMVVVGSAGSASAAAMLDHDGEVRWQKTFNDQTSSFADAVVALPGGEVMIVANSDDASDVPSPWLVRMDAQGAIVAQKRYTLAGGLRVSGGTSAGDNGGFVATGVNEADTLEERDMIVFKVDSAGALAWSKRVSGGDNEWGTAAYEDFIDGHIAVVGGTWSDSFGAADMWIVRLDPNGSLQSQHRIGTASQDSGLRMRPLGPDGAILVGESSAGGNTNFVVVEIKNNALTTQFALDADVSLYASGAALTDQGLVLFGDTDAFGPDIGFFAAGVLAPATLSGCPHTSTPDTDIAASTATSSSISLTVTTTTATAADLEGELTTPALTPVFECE